MFKKILIALVVIAVIMGGLQAFGGRDFGQLSLAFDKYQNSGETGVFLSDIGTIFGGGKIKESVFPSARYNNMVMYRWVDENGQVHVSERQPNVAEFETIKLGDMEFDIQEGMSEEEISAILKKKENQ